MVASGRHLGCSFLVESVISQTEKTAVANAITCHMQENVKDEQHALKNPLNARLALHSMPCPRQASSFGAVVRHCWGERHIRP